MKTIIVTIILTTFALTACGNAFPPTPTQTKTPTLPSTTSVTESPTAEAAYEKMSPSKIRIPRINLTVELSGSLSESELHTIITSSAPVDFLTIFPKGTDPSILQDHYLSTLPTQPFEYYGSGGSSGTYNEVFSESDETIYHVTTPLAIGQRIKITESIIFSEYINVKGEIPLSIELIVEPTSNTSP